MLLFLTQSVELRHKILVLRVWIIARTSRLAKHRAPQLGSLSEMVDSQLAHIVSRCADTQVS